MNLTELIFGTTDVWFAFVTRMTIGIVLFAHGAQKMLGWFGGGGFAGTMNYFTKQQHLPKFVAVMVICVEFFGSLGMILGFATRIWAISIFCLFLGIIFTTPLKQNFFMNWNGSQKGEGYEYHLLMLGLALATLISGGGSWSMDLLFFN